MNRCQYTTLYSPGIERNIFLSSLASLKVKLFLPGIENWLFSSSRTFLVSVLSNLMEQSKHDIYSGNITIIPLDDSVPNLAPYGFCSSCHGIHNPHNSFMAVGSVFLSETCILEIFGYYPCLIEAEGDLECRESISDYNGINRPRCHCNFTIDTLAYRHSAFFHPFPELQRMGGPKVPYLFKSQT